MKNVSMKIKVMFVLTFLILVLSAINPKDFLTWVLEAGPGIIGFGLIAFYWNRFRLSDFLLVLICLHCWILFVGAHYTYAEVPAGFWVRDLFGIERNHYDRLGHFAQGFVPAFLAREILVRKHVVKSSGWLKLFIISICLAFSAFYELIEFAAAMILDSSSDAFLGTQGDSWDTQKDILLAMIGAFTALLFAKQHDRAIAKVENRPTNK